MAIEQYQSLLTQGEKIEKETTVDQRCQHIGKWEIEGMIVTEMVDIGNRNPRAQRKKWDTPAED